MSISPATCNLYLATYMTLSMGLFYLSIYLSYINCFKIRYMYVFVVALYILISKY